MMQGQMPHQPQGPMSPMQAMQMMQAMQAVHAMSMHAARAPPPGVVPNMRPGDWICPSCNNHNYADKIRCNKCGVPKTASTIMHTGATRGGGDGGGGAPRQGGGGGG